MARMDRRIRTSSREWSGSGRGARPRDDWYGADEPPPPSPRRGVQVGPILITPVRVLIVLALAGSIAYLGYAITVRDASSIPLLASGAVVLGLVFAGLAAAGALSVVEAGRMGADGRAFAMALLGGLCAIAAFGCWGAAVVLILLSRAAG
jgi:hypothetical protein